MVTAVLKTDRGVSADTDLHITTTDVPSQTTPQPGPDSKNRGASCDGPPVEMSLDQALPRIRFRLVPHTGHFAFAIRVPFALTTTLPSASRFSLHFTQ